ncbi:hypothetical protein BFP77_08220 [Maribacter sp. 4U21]|uniref:hypothetical protein n=1 Tax=Maribacter sp. 4U21 TaxID=1889779 RepID=UPI000C692517|nr:hypothetical protein [Maribacter sp. 4U21]PIB28892.1 hypothetical protein BFP77_08220 [Maribacter sp. 4U21]
MSKAMTKEQIIARLKENKAKCKQFNFFGEDCHKELDNRILILEKDYSPEQAEDVFGVDSLDVFDVLFGEMDIDDILYPEPKNQ